MKLKFQLHRFYIGEFFVVFCFIFTINNYIGNSEKTINADGIGYYDYLPSAFIHNDLNRQQNTSISLKRINDLGVYIDYQDNKLNKYACGTSILQSPFFLATLWSSDLDGTSNDGYQKQFHRAMYYAALFYIFLTLIFLRGLLLLYDIPRGLIFVCQLLLVLATAITVYASHHASFSHISSLFVITAFLYFVRRFFLSNENRWIVLASIALGLIYLIRPTNVIILLFVPFLADDFGHFKNTLVDFFKNYRRFLLSLVIIGTVSSVQSILWYLQTGSLFLYPYQGEGFNFSKPHFIEILFSYRRGLFLYTPFLFVVLVSGLILLKHRRYQFVCWYAFFLVLTYFLSSWWSWTFGAGYGLRAYIDFYSVFVLLFCIALQEMPKILRASAIIISLACIPINIVQSYQYKMYILDWTNMDKTKYWRVFLKTDERYAGWFFRSAINENHYKGRHEFTIPSTEILKKTNRNLVEISSNDLPQLSKAKAFRIEVFDSFDESENKWIGIFVKNTYGDKIIWDERIVFQYGDPYKRKAHLGSFDYIIPTENEAPVDSLWINLISSDKPASVPDINVILYY